ncbi:hypothetical protein OUZ56_006257 [Daphnia magna]|uniref:Uncharacterized protein n=1 Tax=Daphnia magna TaxID=35525 RepID=A0ABQ9YV39_9CRUS|nr:hypothetical protein OUZ56_006257 [Daphnia magna]
MSAIKKESVRKNSCSMVGVFIWNPLESEQQPRRLSDEKYIKTVDFSSDGRFLAAGGKKKLLIWSAEDWVQIYKLNNKEMDFDVKNMSFFTTKSANLYENKLIVNYEYEDSIILEFAFEESNISDSAIEISTKTDDEDDDEDVDADSEDVKVKESHRLQEKENFTSIAIGGKLRVPSPSLLLVCLPYKIPV